MTAGRRAWPPPATLPSPARKEEQRERRENWEEERERVSQNEGKLGLHPIYTLIQTGLTHAPTIRPVTKP